MLSLFGSKGRIVEAHMSPEQQRLQVRHSELFDFRNVTKEWLDIFVRWFLNEPLAEPSSSCSPDLKMCEQQPETSDDAGRSLLDLASDSDTSLSYGSRTSEQEDVAQKSQAEPSSPCEPEESEQRTENSEDEDEYWVRVRSERVVTPQKPIVKPMWSPGCHSEGTSLYQNLTIPPTLC